MSTFFTMQSEVGYVFNPGDMPDFINRRGVKAKQELRYYFPGRVRIKSAFYAAAELYANWVNFEREDERLECFDLDCQTTFSKQYYYTVKYREQGFSLKGGYQRFFKRLTLDLNLGLSVRFIDYDQPFIPPGLEVMDDISIIFFDFPVEEDRIVPGPVAGFRLGYQIGSGR